MQLDCQLLCFLVLPQNLIPSQCGNYKGISLFNTSGKVYGKVLIVRCKGLQRTKFSVRHRDVSNKDLESGGVWVPASADLWCGFPLNLAFSCSLESKK